MPGHEVPVTSEAVLALRVQLGQLSTGSVAHKDLSERYQHILDSVGQLGGPELIQGLQVFVRAIVNENVSLVISRQLLSDVGAKLVAQQDDAVSKAVSHFTLDIVQPRVISFEDQVSPLKGLQQTWLILATAIADRRHSPALG